MHFDTFGRLVSRPIWRGCFIVFAALSSNNALYATDEIEFNQDIRPILSDRCFACHGPDANRREADLRFDEYENLIQDRGGYSIVVPGDSTQSELWKRIQSSDAEIRMPPPDSQNPLSTTEVERLKQWLDQGAKWQGHWAYEPARYQLPAADSIANYSAAGNWIDSYIAAVAVQVGGNFSAQADRKTLQRRLSFDLTGLPPSAEQLAAFPLSDDSESLNHYIEHLLSTPAFGERMAMYWLDLVRFADTVGYHGDQDHNISPYRDYVIDTLNDDLAFDQFSREQLAGDLLPQPTDEQIVATGYNRLLQTSHEGGVQPKEYLTIYAADRVRNFSAVWMGATIGCAQCHDHKYDPYTAEDFYALSAFFADINEVEHFKVGSNSLPSKRPPERQFLSRLERLQIEQLERRKSNLSPTETENEIQQIEMQLDSIRSQARMCMYSQSIEPRPIRFLARGNWLDETGPLMNPTVPKFLSYQTSQVSGQRLTRLDLANWLFDTETGIGTLTARVFANRMWMLFFGRGLAVNVDDLGGQGSPPSHPELLDRLSLEFIRSGWDIKWLVKQIVQSRAYQQSSQSTSWHRENDPQNRLFLRQSRYRLSAEFVRDCALTYSGLLVSEIGGASVKPYQPPGYYRHLNFPEREYESNKDTGQWRRGVYVHWQRQFLHPMLRAMDAPTREECTAQRPVSNTPLAALVWLNDPSFVEAARSLAIGSVFEFPTRTQNGLTPAQVRSIVREMFNRVTGRLPDMEETQLLVELYSESATYYDQHQLESDQVVQIGNLKVDLPEVANSQLAAWTTVARAVLNLSEAYWRE
ncbi:MAG: PSD1 domain-containing protein [Planctomycetales bacterium]|nr:PSD1 domain-containing protein [Planctomycetales bacterium]